MNSLWMVAYDITDDRRRRRVFRLLKDHGQRVQFSVFECRLTARQLSLLRQRLASELDDTDSVRWYPLCVWCSETVRVQGTGQAPDDATYFLV